MTEHVWYSPALNKIWIVPLWSSESVLMFQRLYGRNKNDDVIYLGEL